MKRVLLGLAAGVVTALVVAPVAFAHGGQYRAPGGNVPPGLREPSDPTPPPPPPPSTPPPTTTPPETTPTPTPAAPPTTPTPSAPGGVTPSDTPQRPQGGKPQTSYDQWIFWWNYNNDDILQIKDAIYQIRNSPQSVLSSLGRGAGRNDATRATEKQVKDKVIPALRWAMDPANKQHPDTSSAGYIALAKITDDPSDIKLIEAAILDKDGKNRPPQVEQIVNESAALALGLLRRTDESRRFDAKELDAVRDYLFQVYDSDALKSGRTRPFAMLALGLLGDQPTNRKASATTGEGGGDAASQTTAAAIFERLKGKYSNDDMLVVAMLALSMQDPTTITPDMLERLKDCVLRQRLWKESVSDLVASYAALALGRIGGENEIETLVTAMKIRQTGLSVKRSAAISLGKLGARVEPARRANLAAELWRAREGEKDGSARNFAIISLAYLLIEDIKSDKTDVLNAKGFNVKDELLKIAGKDGRFNERPYGALALGLVCKEISDRPVIEAYGDLRQKAIEVLREGLTETKMDKRAQGAYAVALGMMKDDGFKKKLVEIVSERGGDYELRGYAAVALGMIGNPAADVVKAIKEALKEHSSDELRLQCAVALGLLGQSDAVPTLINELKEADTQNVQGQVVVALAKIGDSKAIEPLVTLLKDSGKPDATRAIACAGLGLIGDLEMIPSLSHISKDINYRATCDVINEVLSIL